MSYRETLEQALRQGAITPLEVKQVLLKFQPPIRVKVTDLHGNVGYISVAGDRVSFVSDKQIPFGLSNIAGDKASELEFALLDAESPDQAVAAVQKLARGITSVEAIAARSL